MSRLAIVIPAYKPNFLDQALESIAKQTNKEFTLYIGDDNSPHELYGIIMKFLPVIDIVYRRFEENMGGADLVGQWERCIDLVKDEEWIWLFSDDDIMESDCVADFYRTLNKGAGHNLYHFNVKKIDQFNNYTPVQFSVFPKLVTSEKFLCEKLEPGYHSTVVEYIFRKSHFKSLGGFEKFDLAWCTDDATWIKLGMSSGILTIENSFVYWRESQYNISTIVDNPEIFRRKLDSQLAFACWVNKLADEKVLVIDHTNLKIKLRKWFLRSMKYGVKSLSFSSIISYISEIYLILGERQSPGPGISFFFLFKIYRFSVDLVKRSLSILTLKKA